MRHKLFLNENSFGPPDSVVYYNDSRNVLNYLYYNSRRDAKYLYYYSGNRPTMVVISLLLLGFFFCIYTDCSVSSAGEKKSPLPVIFFSPQSRISSSRSSSSISSSSSSISSISSICIYCYYYYYRYTILPVRRQAKG